MRSIRCIHSGVFLEIIKRVVKKCIIYAESDILDPNCSRNAPPSVSTRSQVVVSLNFSFSLVCAASLYGIVATLSSRVGWEICGWSTL